MLSRNTSEELETLIYFIDTTKRKIINFRFLLILKIGKNETHLQIYEIVKFCNL